MAEPNWEDVRRRLTALTMRQLRTIGRSWFAGCLGGASAKAEYVGEMVAQMRHWWRSCADEGGRERVAGVMEDMERTEGRDA